MCQLRVGNNAKDRRFYQVLRGDHSTRIFEPDGGSCRLKHQVFHLETKLTSDITDRVPRGLEWRFFVSSEAGFCASTPQQDPALLQYPNLDHPFTTPVISDEIYVWNRLRHHWDPATFCVTQTRSMLRFEGPIWKLKHNVNPCQSLCLQRTTLGDVIGRSPSLRIRTLG